MLLIVLSNSVYVGTLISMVDKHIKIYDFIVIMLVKIVCMTASMILATYIRYGNILGIAVNFDNIGILYQMIAISLIENFCIDFNHHFFRRSRIDELLSVIKEQFVFVLFMVLWLYMIHDSGKLSRLVFIYYVIAACILEFCGNLALKSFMENVVRSGRSSSRLLILTTAAQAESIIANILSYNEWYRTIVGVALLDRDLKYDSVSLKRTAVPAVHDEMMGIAAEGFGIEAGTDVDQYNSVDKNDGIMGIPVVADCASFLDYVIHNEIDEVFIMDYRRKHMDLVLPWMQTLEEMGITVDANIDIFDLEVRGRKNLGRVGKYAVVTIDRNVLSARQLFAKRCMDIAGAVVGCIILAIASIIVVPAIKLESPGPALFCQKRVGKNGRIFTLYKFRSMYQDAEERKKALMKDNEMQGLMFKMNNDPRVTRVGSFIRKTSIDELPQFINILRGDMSLVGTRPPTVDEYRQYEAKHRCRLSMTPGLTGMWQVSGRSDIKDFDDVVRLDMEYIDNWTISKDIKILIKTIKVVLLRKGSF